MIEIGTAIIADILKTGDPRPYTEHGWTRDWATDPFNLERAAVFHGQEQDAYAFVLSHFERHGKTPPVDLFRAGFPESVFPFPRNAGYQTSELVEQALGAVREVQLITGVDEYQRLMVAGDFVGAAGVMAEVSRKIAATAADSGVTSTWDDPDFDIDAMLDERTDRGPGFGIKELDEEFIGFQPGDLVTLVGRAKSNKTTSVAVSAYHAWTGKRAIGQGMVVEPRKVLIVTFEVSEKHFRQRITAYGAKIEPMRLILQTKDSYLDANQRRSVKEFWQEANKTRDLLIHQPRSRFTVADLAQLIEKHEPDIVYVDGVYFMTDPTTGETAGEYKGQDNIARDLKTLAVKHQIPIVITHQAREKQLGKSGGGFSDTAAMGGTAFRMASDLVMTLDGGADGVVTWLCSAARLKYLPTIRIKWKWETFEMEIVVESESGDEENTEDFR